MGPRLHFGIVLSSLDLVPGGLETLARGIARGLAQRGHRVTVIAGRWPRTHRACDPGIERLTVPWPPLNGPVGRLLRRWRPGRVLSVQSGLFVLGCRLDRRVFRRILDCSVTLTFLERETVAVSRWRAAAGRPNISYFPGAIQQAQLDRDASVVRLAASEMVATHYRDRQGLPIHGVLYPGIDAIAAALPRGSRPGLRILFVGRLESNKGIATLLHIAHRLASQAPTGLPEPLELRLAGEGPLRAEVLRSSAALTGTVRLVCLGALSADAVRAELAAADVFVFPSRYETFGIAVLEALAAGVAVVCSDLPALREVAGEAAIFVPPADLDAWVEATRRVLRDPTLRQHLSAQGPIRARRFTWDETVDTLEAHAWRIAPRGEAPA